MSLRLPKIKNLLREARNSDFRVIKKFAYKSNAVTTDDQVSDIQEAIAQFVEQYFGVKIGNEEDIYKLALEIWDETEIKGELQ